MDRSQQTASVKTKGILRCGICLTALQMLTMLTGTAPRDTRMVRSIDYDLPSLALRSLSGDSLHYAVPIGGNANRSSGEDFGSAILNADKESHPAPVPAHEDWRVKSPAGGEAAETCLSLNVYWEARNQSYAGQLAVAQVTMNRVNDPRYPNDVCQVVYEHKQFSWYWDGKSDIPREPEALETANLVATAAMAGAGHSGLRGVTHYHAVYSSPYWKDYLTLVAVIGDHIFYSTLPDQEPDDSLAPTISRRPPSASSN